MFLSFDIGYTLLCFCIGRQIEVGIPDVHVLCSLGNICSLRFSMRFAWYGM